MPPSQSILTKNEYITNHIIFTRGDVMLPKEKESLLLKSISPSYRITDGESLALWQEKARRKLSELLGLDRFEACENTVSVDFDEKRDGFREIRFKVQTEKDLFVPCHLLIPEKTEGNAPLMICLQGHSTGMHISLGKALYEGDEETIAGDRDFAVQAVSEGYCALAIEQRGFGEMGGTPETQCHEPAMIALLMGRTLIGARVWDIMRIIDGVSREFSHLFNTDYIYCMGNSGGGTATFYATALEPRIKGAIPSCSFCTYKDSIGAIRHCQCNFIPHIAEYFDMAELGGMISPRPLVIVSGQKDRIFPIAPAREEYDRLVGLYYKEAPDKCVHFVGEEGHRYYRGAWEIFKKIR
jgi:hypothetical protein